MALQPFVGPWPLLQFRNLFIQTVGLLGRVISPSQGRYLHTVQHKHRIKAHTQAFSGIRTHDPSVRASGDSSCLRPHGHCHRLRVTFLHQFLHFALKTASKNFVLGSFVTKDYITLHPQRLYLACLCLLLTCRCLCAYVIKLDQIRFRIFIVCF
jgi:hypothetical protein